MIARSTFASLPFSAPALLCLALASCGDSVATSASDTLDTTTGSTTDSTTDVTPTTPTTADETTTTTGGMTGTASEDTTTTTTGPTTGTSTDTGVSATETTSTSTTDGETTSTSTGDTSTSTSDTSTSDASTSTGETDTDGEPVACLAADFPVTAALCGDDGPPCVTVRDEVVSPDLTFRNDMPAIALRGDCEPVVLYSVAENGFHGFYAERVGPGAWAATPMPSPVATGALEADPDGEAMFAMVDDGAFGSTLWRRFAGQWTQESALAGMNHVRAPQLLRDSVGALHVGHIDSNQLAFHEVFDGAWSKAQVLTQADIHVRLALDADDAARLITWSSAEGTWKLHYAAPPAAAEVITPLGSNLLDRPHTGLALVGAEATPWVLLARRQGNPNFYDIVLAHRTGPAAWAFETLAAENQPGESQCNGAPGGPGESCDYDYRVLYPLALLSSASEVRAIYLAIRRQGTMVSECEFNPFQVCWWETSVDTSSSEVRVAWPGSQPDEHQVAAVDVFTDRATARLDTAGNMHLTFYDLPPGTGPDPLVRYLMIGK
ncbi:hypothetical protein [Nannocystis sp. SCPEA4]|uniref:hypothetical protein n=1 Tax=Nannocystis sp. SCPEA4 TaxID=2996787 RepID=UPI0022710C83|nr:hypothetical protein [Nannocystis sp. SCPEA4]MCY1060883.1 hypothetical protein [Nannocystis sp. SCPEA4]